MNVFIMWSGTASRSVAVSLRAFLEAVIQRPEYFVSTDDIESGEVWSRVIAGQLEVTHFGIACITRNNLKSEWIHFEAGAISKVSDNAFVIPYLVGVEPTDITGPLTKFQATRADREGTLSLIKSINNSLPESDRTSPAAVEKVFEALWPELEQSIHEASEEEPGPRPELRSQEELLREILTRVRQMEQGDSRRTAPAPRPLARLSARLPDEVKILWVDDHPENNRTVAQLLLGVGAIIIPVASTSEAIAMLDSLGWQYFDLLITDMDRGGNPTAGLELLERLQAKSFRTPRIVYSTSTLAQETERSIRGLGAEGVIIGAESLLITMGDILG